MCRILGVTRFAPALYRFPPIQLGVYPILLCNRHCPSPVHYDVSPQYTPSMAWQGQDPPATDLLLHLNIPCAGASPAYLEIDKLPDGRYRATVGTLFQYQELCRTTDLEELLRYTHKVGACRSFDDVLAALTALRSL